MLRKCTVLFLTLSIVLSMFSVSASAESPLFDLRLSVDRNFVTISWEPVENAEYYEIHGVENGNDQVLLITESTHYTDSTVGGCVNEYWVATKMKPGTEVMRNSRRLLLSDHLELFDFSVPSEISAKHSFGGRYRIDVKGLTSGMNLQLQMQNTGGTWKDVYVGSSFSTILQLCYNSSYNFRARSIVSVGGIVYYSAYSPTFKLDTSINVPKSFTVKAKNYKSADLSWEKVENASAYTVYRRCGTSDWKKLKTVSKTDYCDSTLCPGVTYYYKIRSCGSIGKQVYNGNFSSAKSVITKLAKPSLDSETTVGCNSARFTWGNVSGTTGYKIEQRVAGGKWKTVKTTKNLSAKVNGLTLGKTYYFRMRAYRSVNGKNYYSDYSAARRVKPTLKKPKLTVKAGSGKFKITTNENSGVSGYEIYYATKKSGTYKKLAVKSGAKLKFSYKGKKSKKYYFKVRAYKKENSKKRYSDFSSIVSCKR